MNIDMVMQSCEIYKITHPDDPYSDAYIQAVRDIKEIHETFNAHDVSSVKKAVCIFDNISTLLEKCM